MRRACSPLLLRIISLLLVGLSISAGSIATPPLSETTKEPERFAFIIGNAHYQLKFSSLDDLPDACREAIDFRKELLRIGWAADHIYPLITPPIAGQSTDDVVKAAICDKTGHEIQEQLTGFINEQILVNENNPYAVIFYAGHGAQNNDEFYAFGVDAQVDFDKELQLLTQYTQYEAFQRGNTPKDKGPIAVNLTRLAASVNGPEGKGLLMIVDACRDNPLLNTFLAAHSTPTSLDPRVRKRLSIAYASRPDRYDLMLSNVMVMFAGRPGEPVRSGTTLSPNWFSQYLFDYLHNPVNLKAPTATFVTTFETKAKRAQKDLSPEAQQIPQHVGSMDDTPRFCFMGCPQPLSDWPNEKVEVIPDPPIPSIRKSERSPASGRIEHVAGEARLIPAKLVLASAVAVELVPALAVRSARTVAKSTALPPQGIKFDVYYCAGDALEAERAEKARAYAAALRQAAPRDLVLDGTFIDQVRVRSYAINTNLALKQPRTGTILVLYRKSAGAQAWQDRLKAGFDRSYQDEVTYGYFRAYFCTGFQPHQKPRPLVYAQVSHASQVPQAKRYLAQVAPDLPGVKFVNGIEPVDDSHPDKVHTPNQTQLRCYAFEPCQDAEKVAAKLRPLLSQPVSVVKLPISSVAARKNPVIELWFGLNELSGWKDAVPASP